MTTLLGKNINELQTIAQELGLPKYAGKQLAQWLYVKRVRTIDEMTNLSLSAREALKQHYTIGRHAPVREAVSVDGTRKYLFQVGEQFVESVYIPVQDEETSERATLCVSTQMGCKMGCRFCMTGTLGFHGNLSAGEILNQILEIDAIACTLSSDGQGLTNIVYMGEGEPMDNIDEVLRSLNVMTSDWACAWSPRRITVSTVGILPGLQRFLDESECHLAISLHNPFTIERQTIMPADKMYHLSQVIQMVKPYDWSHQRRLSLEYICWSGVNDTLKHANELLRLFQHIPCRVNLIRFHEGVNRDFPASNDQQMVWFRDYLTQHGLTTTIRRSRGEDILAACGMLVNSLQ